MDKASLPEHVTIAMKLAESRLELIRYLYELKNDAGHAAYVPSQIKDIVRLVYKNTKYGNVYWGIRQYRENVERNDGTYVNIRENPRLAERVQAELDRRERARFREERRKLEEAA